MQEEVTKMPAPPTIVPILEENRHLLHEVISQAIRIQNTVCGSKPMKNASETEEPTPNNILDDVCYQRRLMLHLLETLRDVNGALNDGGIR